MQAEKEIPKQFDTEEQLLLSTGGQLLRDGRMWLSQAVELYTRTSKTKVWVPIFASTLMSAYYLYNSHVKAAPILDLPPAQAAQSAQSAPVVVAEVSTLPARLPSPGFAAPASSDVDDNDDSPAGLLRRSAKAHSDQRFGDEAKLLQQFADRSSSPQQACPALGRAYERAGEINPAVKALERCVQLDPGNVDTLVALGHVLESKGSFESAASLYRKGLSKDPRNLDAKTGLALIDLKQNHLREAAKEAQAILVKAPDSSDALLIAGLVAWREARLADAEKIFTKGVGIDDRRSDFHAFLGRIAEAQGHPQDALRQYDRALELDPHDTLIADRRDHLKDSQ